MTFYPYRCDDCGENYLVSFNEKPKDLSVCPNDDCGGLGKLLEGRFTAFRNSYFIFGDKVDAIDLAIFMLGNDVTHFSFD